MVHEKSSLSRGLMAAALAIILFVAPVSPDAFAQAAKSGDVVSLRDGLKTMLQNEGATSLKKLSVTVGEDQSTKILKERGVKLTGTFTVYRGVDESGAEIGSVVTVNEDGKEGPLQVLVAFRPDGSIYDIGFTVFGEDRGKPALSFVYLKQFIGKTTKASFELGKDIDGISGATWTSNSVASAIKKAAALHAEFVAGEGS